MRFYRVEVEATIPASQTVLVWAKDEDEAKDKALEGRTLEDGDVIADDYQFEPEDVIDCEEVPEDEVDEEIISQAREEANEQPAEEVAAL
jgi:hypothetical protein